MELELAWAKSLFSPVKNHPLDFKSIQMLSVQFSLIPKYPLGDSLQLKEIKKHLLKSLEKDRDQSKIKIAD